MSSGFWGFVIGAGSLQVVVEKKVERCKGSVELFKPGRLHEDTSQQD